MNHIRLDTLPKPIREFIRELRPGPEGLAFVDGGRPVAFLSAIPNPPKGRLRDSEWTEAKNHRRCHLIDREIDGTLTAAERIELECLQRELDHYVERVAPLPLEPLLKLHQQLLKKAARTRAAGPK